MSEIIEMTTIGRVEAIRDGMAFVSLWDPKTGLRWDAEVLPLILSGQGIGEGDEFRSEVVRGEDGKVRVTMARLEPKDV